MSFTGILAQPHVYNYGYINWDLPRNPQQPCHTCGDDYANTTCSDCKNINYCNNKCAEKDYINHKIECRLWRLSDGDVNNAVIEDNSIIALILNNLGRENWEFPLAIGATCKSWRAYVKSLHITDDTHKLYYTDDNLVGVIYSLKRRNPAYQGDFYSHPIYEAMAKSGKTSYSVMKYINYVNKWEHLKPDFLAHYLCKYNIGEMHNCLDKYLLPNINNYYAYINVEVSLKILIRDHVVDSGKINENISIIYRIIEERYKNDTNYSRLVAAINRAVLMLQDQHK